jgi:uncharacterized membrane protein YeaQ/YmgE (transglycosylase-associated protein family)
MNLFSFLILLLIASIAGGIGASIGGRKKTGCLASIVLGFIGSLIGTYIARQLDLPLIFSANIGGHPFPFIWAVAGAALFVAFLNLISRPGSRS